MFDNENDFSGDFDVDVAASERTPMLADHEASCSGGGGGTSVHHGGCGECGDVDAVDSVLPNVDDEQTWLIGSPLSSRSPSSGARATVTDELLDLDLTSLKLRQASPHTGIYFSSLYFIIWRSERRQLNSTLCISLCFQRHSYAITVKHHYRHTNYLSTIQQTLL